MDLIEVSWLGLKSNMEAKKLASVLQWVQEAGQYRLFLFDGPMRLTATIPISDPKNAQQFEFETKYKATSNLLLNPLDQDNSPMSRVKITKAGWTFQLHTIGMLTGKRDGCHNKNLHPTTLTMTDLGFATIKLYKENKSLLGAEENENLAHYSVIDWAVNHEIEIIGGEFSQGAPPTNDIWMWTYGAPGIANVAFCQGGVNLKRLGAISSVNADGKVPKYLHPTIPIPGVNKFRIIFYHPTYEAHPTQMMFHLFKP